MHFLQTWNDPCSDLSPEITTNSKNKRKFEIVFLIQFFSQNNEKRLYHVSVNVQNHLIMARVLVTQQTGLYTQ